MPKKDFVQPEIVCPIRETLKLLGKRWTILVVKEIYYSQSMKRGFMDLKRGLDNISTKMLSERLKEMAQSDLVNRHVDSSKTPPRVNYTLTMKGRDVCKILSSFKEFGLKWGGKDKFDCKDHDCELCTHERQLKNETR